MSAPPTNPVPPVTVEEDSFRKRIEERRAQAAAALPDFDKRIAERRVERSGIAKLPFSATIQGPTAGIEEPDPTTKEYAVTPNEAVKEIYEVVGTMLTASSLVFPQAKVANALKATLGLSGKGLEAGVAIARSLWAGGGGAAFGEFATLVYGRPPEEKTPFGPEAMQRRLIDFGEGALGESAGAFLNRFVLEPTGRLGIKAAQKIPGVRRLVQPFTDKMEPGAREAIEQLAEQGIVLPPGQASRSQFVDVLSNVISNALWGSGKYRAMKGVAIEHAELAIRQWADAITKNMEPEDAGRLLQQILENEEMYGKELAQSFYKTLDRMVQPEYSMRQVGEELVEGRILDANGRVRMLTVPKMERYISRNGVNIRSAKEWFRKKIESERKGFGNPKLEAIWSKLEAMPDVVDWETAAMLRSQAIDIGAAFQEGADRVAKRTEGVARALSGKIHDDMRRAAQSFDRTGLAWRLFETGNEIWKKRVRGEIQDYVFQSVLNSHPDAVVDVVLKARSPTRIRRMRQIAERYDKRVHEEAVAAGKKKATEPIESSWQNVQGNFVEKMMFDSMDMTTGELSGKRFLTNLRKFGGWTGRALKEVLPEGKDEQLLKLARTLTRAQAEAGGNRAGAMLIQFTQASAFATLGAAIILRPEAKPEATAAAVALILTPRVFASLLFTKGFSNWLTVGMLQAPGTKTAARAFSQLITHMEKEEIPHRVEKLPAEFMRLPARAKEAAEQIRPLERIETLVGRGEEEPNRTSLP